MSEDIKQTVREAELSLLELLGSFEDYIDSLPSETPDDEVKRLKAASMALRDSAGIYMTWAKQFSKQISTDENSEEEDYLSEDSQDFQNPIFG